MKLQTYVSLSKLYSRETDFSIDLAKNLSALNVGQFDDAETESTVGTRKADIAAQGDDGILIVENQFGCADWDHWGRLEAYARLKEANVAVLVAEDFEELMIVTCHLRNEDSQIDWYLIQAQVNCHDEVSFHHVVRPLPDLDGDGPVECSEFWEPIRRGQCGTGVFAGKSVRADADGWISKAIRGINVSLELKNHNCSVSIYIPGEDRHDRRSRVMELFPADVYPHQLTDSSKFAIAKFPAFDKGRKDCEDWEMARNALNSLGEDIFCKIRESDV